MNFEENVFALIRDLDDFEYSLENVDHIWDIIYPDKKDKYFYIRVTKYQEVFYIGHINGDYCSLEVHPKKGVTASSTMGIRSYNDYQHDPAIVWNDLITYARKWLQFVKKDWIKANKQMYASYPLKYRYGIVPNSLVRASIPDIYRIDKELGKSKVKKFIRLVEDGYFHKSEKTIRDTMTANDFFEYCKIAYISGHRKEDHVDEKLTGREMYERYADGRDEGLLDIEPDSESEFADWIDGKHPKKTSGGHPWEIKRGGNTTHIDLYVSRPQYHRSKSFKVCLCGASIGRLKETIGMFLGIYDAGLPIAISDPEGIRKRLLALDNIGIIPSYNSLHRGNQHFGEEENVNDVMHFDDLGRYKTRIKPFIVWEPLPLLYPKGYR
ncbi:MAG: hypothetical protein ACHQUC_01810 [Chlamydiales bacterium]